MFIVVVAGGWREAVEPGDLVGSQDEVGGEVLFEALDAFGAGDGDDALAAGQEPGERDLRG